MGGLQVRLRKTAFVAALVLMLTFGCVQTQAALTQFGNLEWTSTWNKHGSYMIASQFTIQESITVDRVSAFMQDDAPPTDCFYAIYSDANNLPYQCLASTPKTSAHVEFVWYGILLTSPVKLSPGTYWLAEIDTGAGVNKYINTASSGRSISVFFPVEFPVHVGDVMPQNLNFEYGTLAIAASLGPLNTNLPTPTPTPNLNSTTITPENKPPTELIINLAGIIFASTVIASLCLLIYRSIRKRKEEVSE